MARKRKAKVIYKYKKARKSSKKGSSQGLFNLSGLMKPIASVGYGFFRDKVSDAVARTSLAKQLPVTRFTDEGVMLGIMFLSRKLGLGKNKIAGSVIRNGETVEWARIGETLSDIQQAKRTGLAATPGGIAGAGGMVVIG